MVIQEDILRVILSLFFNLDKTLDLQCQALTEMEFQCMDPCLVNLLIHNLFQVFLPTNNLDMLLNNRANRNSSSRVNNSNFRVNNSSFKVNPYSNKGNLNNSFKLKLINNKDNLSNNKDSNNNFKVNLQQDNHKA